MWAYFLRSYAVMYVIFNSQSLILSGTKYMKDVQLIVFYRHVMDVECSFFLYLYIQ